MFALKDIWFSSIPFFFVIYTEWLGSMNILVEHGWIVKLVCILFSFVYIYLKTEETWSSNLKSWSLETMPKYYPAASTITWMVCPISDAFYAKEIPALHWYLGFCLDHAFCSFISRFPFFLYFRSFLQASVDKWLLLHQWLISMVK